MPRGWSTAWHRVSTQEVPGEIAFHLKAWPTPPEAEHRAASYRKSSLPFPSGQAFSFPDTALPPCCLAILRVTASDGMAFN